MESGADAPKPNELIQLLASTDGAVAAERITALDEISTAYLDRADREAVQRDQAELSGLVEEMRAVLLQLGAQAAVVGDALGGLNDEAVETILERILADREDAAELQSVLADELDGYPLREALIGACHYVHRQAESEAGDLSQKLERILEGEVEPGDISFDHDCALRLFRIAAAIVVVSLTLTPPTIIAGAAVIVDNGIRLWKNRSCHKALRAIMGRPQTDNGAAG